MKKLEELGISPAPWLTALNAEGEFATDVVAPDYTVVANCINTQDASLIAAAPELYDAVQRYVSADDEMDAVTVNEELIERRKTAYEDMRAALRKASGESEARK